MPRPRRETVSSTEPGVYHCHSGFTQGFEFMGKDPVAKKFRGHRRQWVIDKCRKLARAFPVEIISLTVRAHCYDMVIHFDPTVAREWADREVVEHWSSYYVLRRDEAEKRRELTEEDFKEILRDRKQVARWRERLCHLGELMQELNGRIASHINRENCGHGAVWASRYEATVLLDEVAVLTAIASTEMAGVEFGRHGEVSISTYSTLRKRVRRTAHGWQPDGEGWETLSSLQEDPLKLAAAELRAETLKIVLSLLLESAFCPRRFAYNLSRDEYDPVMGDIISDLSLWFTEWLMKKDLPKRAIGAPALLAGLAMKLGLKRLNLSWLGNGIYPGTENEKGRRARRNKSRLSPKSARGEPKQNAPG